MLALGLQSCQARLWLALHIALVLFSWLCSGAQSCMCVVIQYTVMIQSNTMHKLCQLGTQSCIGSVAAVFRAGCCMLTNGMEFSLSGLCSKVLRAGLAKGHLRRTCAYAGKLVRLWLVHALRAQVSALIALVFLCRLRHVSDSVSLSVTVGRLPRRA